MHDSRNIAIVILSVLLSVMLRYYIKKVYHIIILSSAYGSPVILDFPILKSLQNSDSLSPMGALNTGGYINFALCD